MSALENEAQPILTALMSALSFELAASQRKTVARWALKTAMAFEPVGGAGWFYMDDEREIVRAGDMPSGYSAFWAARCRNLSGAYAAANNLFEHPDRIEQGLRGHVSTLAVGTLALQVITVRPSAAIAPHAAIDFPGANADPWPKAAIQLWPPTGNFHWPPSAVLVGEAGVENLANRFRFRRTPQPTDN